MDVAVIGAGIAGLAVSAFLARDGHRVTIFEAVPRPGAVGAGLLLQPTGLSILARLGLDEAIRSSGARVDRLFGTIAPNRTVLDLRYADSAPDAHGVGIHRGVLFEALWSAMSKSGVAVQPGAAVTSLRQDEHAVRVETSAGASPPFDLAIVADGTFSKLRATLRIEQRCTPYPWGAWWTILPDRERRFRHVLRQWYCRADRMMGIMPVGRSPSRLPDVADDVPHVTLFWSVRSDAERALRERGLDAWKSDARALAPEIEPLLADVNDPAQLLVARYADVRMRAWHDGRIAIIGDAAHATSPQLGQGANLALIDAAVLACCAGAHADPVRALAAYSAARRDHLRYYQWASGVLTPMFQSNARVLPWLRDLSMGVVCRVAPLRAPMLSTLTGARTGIVFARRDLGIGERDQEPVGATTATDS